MNKWRYGLVRNEHGAAIHEIHMNDHGDRTGMTSDPIAPTAFTSDGPDLAASVIWQLEKMLADVRAYGVEEA